MGNRYVWSKYNREWEIDDSRTIFEASCRINGTLVDVETHRYYLNDVHPNSNGNISYTRGSSFQGNPSNGRYFQTYLLSSEGEEYPSEIKCFKAQRGTQILPAYHGEGDPQYVELIVVDAYNVRSVATKGGAAGSSSNASSAAYPPRDNREKISVICVIPPANERRVCNV